MNADPNFPKIAKLEAIAAVAMSATAQRCASDQPSPRANSPCSRSS